MLKIYRVFSSCESELDDNFKRMVFSINCETTPIMRGLHKHPRNDTTIRPLWQAPNQSARFAPEM